MYNWITLLCTWNIVNQPHFNKNIYIKEFHKNFRMSWERCQTFQLSTVGKLSICLVLLFFFYQPSSYTHNLYTWYIRFTPNVCVFSCVRLFETPRTVACQAPLSMGFSRQEYWNESPFPPSGDLLNPGIEPASLVSPELEVKFFTTSATWEVLDLHPTTCLFWELLEMVF